MENFNDYRVGDKVKRGPEKWIRTLDIINKNFICSKMTLLFSNDVAIVKEPMSFDERIGILYGNINYWVDSRILLGHDFEWSEEIEVSNNGKYWITAKFSGYAPGSTYPVKTIPRGSYRYARPIRGLEIMELTLDQIAEKFGVPVERIKVKK